MFGLGRFQMETRLAFELGEAGSRLSPAATGPKGQPSVAALIWGCLTACQEALSGQLGSLGVMGQKGRHPAQDGRLLTKGGDRG